ncbi:oligosaccharide flippase family protein [Alkalihalobacillus sp. LMS39]|uniref:oligosaccharide flippase family protein n=1 Tax=Alkalihalobacillus sp. LMS39 TaxID=2924032 RepID=UPI001FB2EC36|nr:oligosaccharide flippase family protein [Alkalihalobacillus sp. LMS39]UOE95443.1 oligosaccharide flippase family protein [Alkalihalobacillus sp. LMS39]
MSVKDVKRGIISSYGILTADIIVGILFTPFLIRSLGQSEYGVYALMGAFVASIAIIDFGFGNAITRYISQYRAEGKKEKEANFLGICFTFYFLIAIVTLILGFIFLYLFDYFYQNSFSLEEIKIAKSIFIIMILNISMSFFIGAFNSYLQAYEKYPLLNLITLFKLLLRVIILIILLSLGYKAIAVVIVDTILNFIMGVSFLVICVKKLGFRIKFSTFDFTFFKELTGYSSFVFLSNIADMLFWRLGLLLLGVISNTSSIAIYAVGITLISYFQYISGVINGKLFPMITRMVVNKSTPYELTIFISRVARFQLIIVSCVLLGFQLFGKEFITLWVGIEYIDSWSVAQILMISMILQILQYPCVLILRAKKIDAFRTIMQLLFMLIGGGIGVLLYFNHDIVGMAMGLAIANVLLNWILLNIYYIKVLNFQLIYFLKEISKMIPSISVVTILGFLISFLPHLSWSLFIGKCVLFVLAFTMIIWKLGLNNSERRLILDQLTLFLPIKKENMKTIKKQI